MFVESKAEVGKSKCGAGFRWNNKMSCLRYQKRVCSISLRSRHQASRVVAECYDGRVGVMGKIIWPRRGLAGRSGTIESALPADGVLLPEPASNISTA